MLRITVENGSLTTRLKLEGKLAHEWVPEVEKAWAGLVVADWKRKLVVDLFDVSFVDDAGWKLLAEIHHSGARLVGSGPLISALIEEIESKENAESGPRLAPEEEERGR
ncbi:MAG: hypothetical protein JST79_15150 [Acidobacteria bacterium]|jgi:anti-anti-sigma regulatory factor|nr:hypothetical protein [Acidobacteriota bacterium]